MSTERLVLRDDADGVTTLTLNRPDKLNALNPAVFIELREHLDAIAGDGSVKVVVLTGAGRSFCAGNDLAAIAAGERAPSRHLQAETIDALEQLPQPTIAKVRGHCFTGGLELALGCDLIVASAASTFGDTHGQWGMVPVWGMSVRLPERVGLSTAKKLMFTARRIDGTEAARIGLADEVVRDDEFDAAAAALAARDRGELDGHLPDRQAAAARRHDDAAQRRLELRAGPAVRSARRHGRADVAQQVLTTARAIMVRWPATNWTPASTSPGRRRCTPRCAASATPTSRAAAARPAANRRSSCTSPPTRSTRSPTSPGPCCSLRRACPRARAARLRRARAVPDAGRWWLLDLRPPPAHVPHVRLPGVRRDRRDARRQAGRRGPRQPLALPPSDARRQRGARRGPPPGPTARHRTR